MNWPILRPAICLACTAALLLFRAPALSAGELSADQVLGAIDRAKRYLLNLQQPDGYWSSTDDGAGGPGPYPVGATSLALLALLNTGMTVADPEIERGLAWLRRREPTGTYELALMVQALAAARDGDADRALVTDLVVLLEQSQIRGGHDTGSWGYNIGVNNGARGDRSNGQFAVLALRDAQEMGVPVSHETWERARHHWLGAHNQDGGWGYSGKAAPGQSSASMTVAGMAVLIATEAMLKAEERELRHDGTPVCCQEPKPHKALEAACRWLGNHFAVGSNPGGTDRWLLYYLYGLERAGRFSGRRFFINGRGEKHDWYREGADYLVSQQDARGSWNGRGLGGGPAVATSFPLIFLSKGLAPVLVNKLEYGRRDPKHQAVLGSDWNRHPDDARNLTQFITGLPRWPGLLNWQTVDVGFASVADLLQAPIVFISGSDPPHFAAEEVALLKEYIDEGGLVFATNNCESKAFDEGFRDLVRQIVPPAEAPLRRLTGDHPVFRSEYNLVDPKSGEPLVELWGVDIGCRTSIIYSPADLSCLWDKWTSFELPGRPRGLLTMISRAMRVGVNVAAYATGRELFNKMQRQEKAVAEEGPIDRIERDLLQISKIRYSGDWDAAPQALKHLLMALNKTAGMAASTKERSLTLVDPNLFRYPIAYMHGRYDFALGRGEQEKLREYIAHGGILFSDACCGNPDYDHSFRRLMQQVFPDKPLKQIPVEHELFSAKVGHELKKVRRRETGDKDAGGLAPVREVEPFLEGIEIGGRFVVIYSKYDISCALHRQAAVPCVGYMYDDAVKIAVNVVLYALLQ